MGLRELTRLPVCTPQRMGPCALLVRPPPRHDQSKATTKGDPVRKRLRDFSDTRPTQPNEWPVGARQAPRVLVEAADGAVRSAMQWLLEQDGYEVAACGGPEEFRAGACPLVETGRCSTAEGADVIVNSLGMECGHGKTWDVLRAVRERVSDTPVVVEIAQPRVASHADELAGCRVAPFPMWPAELRAHVRAAVNGD